MVYCLVSGHVKVVRAPVVLAKHRVVSVSMLVRDMVMLKWHVSADRRIELGVVLV